MMLRAARLIALTLVACVLPPARAGAEAPDPPLPFVDDVRIGPAPPDSICARLPIEVTLRGAFPDACHVLKDVQVLDMIMAPFPHPPAVRIVVSEDCPRNGCPTVMTPWGARVTIPGLPSGDFRLPLQLQLVTATCDGGVASQSVTTSSVPFRVGGPCPPAPADTCLTADWHHDPTRTDICDDVVAPDHPASVTLEIGTTVALAALQGGLTLSPPGLHISALEAVGPAAGMHLTWRPTPEGARFTLFADAGAPIPPGAGGPMDRVPVLKVTAAVTPGMPVPPVTRVYATGLLGATANASAVHECPIRYLDPGIAIIAPAGVICARAGTGCDLNHDGMADVRDLVLMIHCVLQSGDCPPDAAGTLDCNRDGTVSIDDVLCCARRILFGFPPAGPPGRPEPSVHVGFGVPSRSPVGLDLPLRVSGADRLGAARVTLGFPDDRYELLGIDGPSNAGSWLRVEQVDGGRLAIGLIGALPAPGATALDLVVHFALKPGKGPGGAMRVDGGEFSGPDGEFLEVTLDQPPLRLDGPTGLALSAGEPNPFSRSARFTVTLERPAEVEVAVLDLSGRLVAIVHRGALGPGTYPFVWNGTRADGSAAPDGLYFYRARAAGESATRKLILLRGH